MENISLQELLHYIVSHLVEFPDQIQISVTETDDTVTLELKVAQSDMGKVIGRQGKIAKEIRTVLKSAGQHQSKRVDVSILV